MIEYVTLAREEYDNLQHMTVMAVQYSTTIDMILDELKNHMEVDDGDVCLNTFVNLGEIGHILKYRHPDEWNELISQVRAEHENAEH